MKVATGESVLRAFARAVFSLAKDEDMTSRTVSAGFIIPPNQPRGKKVGVQVFVKACAYSDERLRRDPKSGGLAVAP